MSYVFYLIQPEDAELRGGGGAGGAGESASVPAASESCKSGENRDVFHLSAAGRLRSLELPAAWRMYGFCFPEVLRADYAG